MQIEEQPVLTEEEEKIRFEALKNCGKQLLKKSLPIGLGRMAMAANNLGTGIVLVKLGGNAVKASPYISTFMFVSMGISRGCLSSTGIVLGKANGIAKQLEKINSTKTSHAFFVDEQSIEEYQELGKISRQSLILSTALSFLSAGILLSSKEILLAANIDEEVAREVQNFFNWYALGIWPTFYQICDTQIIPVTRGGYVPLISNAVYSLLSSGIGIPMALGYTGDYLKGTKGLGLGVSIGAWLSWFGLRAHFYFTKDYQKYDLFSFHMHESTKYLKELIKLGIAMGYQVGTEWLNLLIISLLIGAQSSWGEEAIEPAMQYLSCFALISLGLAQANGSLMSEAMGSMTKAFEENLLEEAHAHKERLDLLNEAGHIIGFLLSSSFLGITFTCLSPLTKVFLSDKSLNNADIVSSAQNALGITALTNVFDTHRILFSGTLQAFKDVIIPSTCCFVLMSGIGIATAYIYPKAKDDSTSSLIVSFFITKLIFTLAAALVVAKRYCNLYNESIERNIERLKNNFGCGFFSRGQNIERDDFQIDEGYTAFILESP